MKKPLLIILAAMSVAASPLTLVSCQTGPNAQAGTAMGAVGGGALGAIIGNQSHNALGGAAIGAVAGGAAGNYVGGAYDR